MRLGGTSFLVRAAKPMGIIRPGEPGTAVSAEAPRLTEAQARNRATWQGRIAERMWGTT